MEYVIGDKIQLEMKVNGKLLFGGTYECVDKFPEFSKGDLKPGMMVECRDGVFAVILPFQSGLSTFTKDGVALNLCRFTDDLKYPDSYAIDIIKVYGLSENARDMLNFSKEHRELLWERKERRRMTIGEIKRIAEEKIGEQIEVVEELRNDRITIGGVVFTDIKEAQAVLNKVSEWEDVYKRLAGRK